MDFELQAPYEAAGDQPKAIAGLADGIKKGMKEQTLLGVTGSGKTFTMASVVAELQRPTLVIAHNKTLAAQLASEFQEFFPKNAVHYFVSYYDYYQPEAYIPRTDTYIEKESQINEEIDRLRHASTQDLLSRRDVLIVASVSCIYGLGSPVAYLNRRITMKVGEKYPMKELLNKLVDMQYQRNDVELKRGTFTVRGELLELFPKFTNDRWYRFRFFGDELETIEEIHYLENKVLNTMKEVDVYPATHYIPDTGNKDAILKQMKSDLDARVAHFKKIGKLLEAERIEQRTTYDLDMIREVGYTNGIENYSRYFDGREAGTPPYTLLDFFPKDFLLFVDESHMTLPQIRGMYAGDQARKENLVEYGFRLPAAKDNRPLNFDEFNARLNQSVYVSATPAEYELRRSERVVEQVARPTGLLDPEITIRPTAGQVDDLIERVKERVAKNQRVLVTTLTKKMAEDLADYLQAAGIKTMYLHSDVETMDRLETLRDLRLGTYDVLVGINLLREGLDLPEVSLVCILDADKEGFLRSDVSLIQTMGRAARHEEGHVVMYADRITASMRRAIDETERRRALQQAYNLKHGIVPRSAGRAIRNDRISGGKKEEHAVRSPLMEIDKKEWASLPPSKQKTVIGELEAMMELAAGSEEFEKAAQIRDKIKELQRWKM